MIYCPHLIPRVRKGTGGRWCPYAHKKGAYALAMAVICPKCETKEPKDFYLGKLKMSETSEATRGKHWIQMMNMEVPRCKKCDSLGITEKEMKVKELKLLHALDPKVKGDYEAMHPTTPKQASKVILLWFMVGVITFIVALALGWVS
jgi:hypothetical protein